MAKKIIKIIAHNPITETETSYTFSDTDFYKIIKQITGLNGITPTKVILFDENGKTKASRKIY